MGRMQFGQCRGTGSRSPLFLPTYVIESITYHLEDQANDAEDFEHRAVRRIGRHRFADRGGSGASRASRDGAVAPRR
ncbi:hypothetical protein BGLA2_1500007 [Burkholderia gladioli]|nr:hypothetical protein BGLA2_1500007 [Burkholderia gladioli]